MLWLVSRDLHKPVGIQIWNRDFVWFLVRRISRFRSIGPNSDFSPSVQPVLVPNRCTPLLVRGRGWVFVEFWVSNLFERGKFSYHEVLERHWKKKKVVLYKRAVKFLGLTWPLCFAWVSKAVGFFVWVEVAVGFLW